MDEKFLPTQAELDRAKRERLAQALPPTQREFLPASIRRQLLLCIDKHHTFPANAVAFLQKRVRFLEQMAVPHKVFQISRKKLPVQDADEARDYSPVDYLTAVYAGASLFPLKRLAEIQGSKTAREIREMDPMVRRELARRGLLGIHKATTRLDPNSIDVRMLRAAMSTEHLLSVVTAAAHCFESARKRELFIMAVQARLGDRSAQLEEYRTPEKENITAAELQELIHRENLEYIMQELHTTAGDWVENTFPKDGAVRVLPASTVPLSQFLQIIDADPFWFSDWADADIDAFLSSFETAIFHEIDIQLLEASRKKISTYAQSIFPQPRQSLYTNMYLGQPLPDMVRSVAAQQARESIHIYLEMLRNTLAGSTVATDIKQILDRLSDRLKEDPLLHDNKIFADRGAPAANDPGPGVTAIADDRRFTAATSEPITSLYQNVRALLETICISIELTPREIRSRFLGIAHHIAPAYIRLLATAEDSLLRTTDFYSPYEESANTHDVYRMYKFIYANEEQARSEVYRLIDQELMKLPNEQFINCFNRMLEPYQGRSFGTYAFSETYSWVHQDNIPNSLPQTRQRLVRLIAEQPTACSPKLQQNFKNWTEKKNKE